MARTYTQIQRQIEALQKQADKLRQSEVSGVVERIKTAIEHYGLTAEQLFGARSDGARTAASSSAKAADKSARTKAASTAAYADDAGNTWGGRGPRPKWLRDAIAAGKSLEDFATKAKTASGATAEAKKQKSVATKRKATSYRDDAGNSWSGFGPKPGWLRDALAAGKTLEDLAASPSKN